MQEYGYHMSTGQRFPSFLVLYVTRNAPRVAYRKASQLADRLGTIHGNVITFSEAETLHVMPCSSVDAEENCTSICG